MYVSLNQTIVAEFLIKVKITCELHNFKKKIYIVKYFESLFQNYDLGIIFFMSLKKLILSLVSSFWTFQGGKNQAPIFPELLGSYCLFPSQH